MCDSRCGICCSTKDCKKDFGFDCKGCSNESSAPWGACELKKCCEDKGHMHCGECVEFPCELLNSFSYAEEHGDNGERINQCRRWCGNDN